MRSGTYGGINGGYGLQKNGSPTAWITIYAYDGDLTATITNAFLQPCSYISFQGISFANNDYQCVNVCGLETSWRVYTKSHHIKFQRCKFHTTDTNGTREVGSEVFKSSQSEYLLVEDCEMSAATTQSPTDASVAMDFVWVSYSTVPPHVYARLLPRGRLLEGRESVRRAGRQRRLELPAHQLLHRDQRGRRRDRHRVRQPGHFLRYRIHRLPQQHFEHHHEWRRHALFQQLGVAATTT